MITEKDLQEAIAECQGTRNPNAKTCIMLAAFMTIKDHMYPHGDDDKSQMRFIPSQSYATYDEQKQTIDYISDSEFSHVTDGKRLDDVLQIIDELMITLQVIQPRLYNSVIRKIDDI